ncbi:DUF86 domain-containing protein [Ornithinibacillus gellani]|uniref:DUF86 domain-containing protein n=1 Tax=Ornithinibacillus gellani TaxID=2293253 RepID=UPI000F491F79|nr:DUF86 domain-containing protein [Ornithinibacillus gellani]TQS75992.1 DUF86 domain-containing protein [Ornithinibacillus gellani]
MYFVNRQEIEAILAYMETLLEESKQHRFESKLEKLALERLVHMLIESIIDVGNKMIDGFIMRDPGSYEDIIEILVDEKVLPQDELPHYVAFIKLRDMLVREYHTVNHEQLITAMQRNQQMLGAFNEHITSYLDNELGVANTFSNEK